jgi:hypothetical protein
MRLKHIKMFSDVATSALSVVGNILELRVPNSGQIMQLTANHSVSYLLNGRRVMMLRIENADLFVCSFFNQAKSCEMEYRIRSLRPVSSFLTSIVGTNIWYPSLMTMNAMYQQYVDVPGTGVYGLSASSTSEVGGEYRACNRNLGDQFSTTAFYNASGFYIGTKSTNGVLGEWYRIDFPYVLYISGFTYYQASNSVRKGTIVGVTASDVLVNVWTGNIPQPDVTWYTYSLTTPGQYKAMIFVCQECHGSTRFRIQEFAYIGNYTTVEPRDIELTFEVKV